MLTYALDVSTYPLYHIFPYVAPTCLVVAKDYMGFVVHRLVSYNTLKLFCFSSSWPAPGCPDLDKQIALVVGITRQRAGTPFRKAVLVAPIFRMERSCVFPRPADRTVSWRAGVFK